MPAEDETDSMQVLTSDRPCAIELPVVTVSLPPSVEDFVSDVLCAVERPLLRAFDSECEITELTALLSELAARSMLAEVPRVYPWDFPSLSTTVPESVTVTVVPLDLLVALLQLSPRAREYVSLSTWLTPFALEKPMDSL